MISTRDLTQLPSIDALRRLLQSMAMLDAILCREWQYRYYSFNARWSEGEQMGSMRDGCGDDFHALFNRHGCFLKGFAHESPLSPYGQRPHRTWEGVLEDVPTEFADCLAEPAFDVAATTFCIWRRHGDSTWQRGTIRFPPGPDPDGSKSLLSPLDGNPETYLAWAVDYFEMPSLTLDMVRHVYEHRPLTDQLLDAMRPDLAIEEEEYHLEVADLEDDVQEIGYPI